MYVGHCKSDQKLKESLHIKIKESYIPKKKREKRVTKIHSKARKRNFTESIVKKKKKGQSKKKKGGLVCLAVALFSRNITETSALLFPGRRICS